MKTLTTPLTQTPTRHVGRLVLVCLALLALACGPGMPLLEEPETWMLRTFSTGGIPTSIPGCSTAGTIMRFTFGEDRSVEIVTDSHLEGNEGTLEFRAIWEQREYGRVRVMRDELHADVDLYPILKGIEWEITQPPECEESDRLLWFEFEEIIVATGDRYSLGRITPGVLCTFVDEGEEICPATNGGEFAVDWCQGSQPTFGGCD